MTFSFPFIFFLFHLLMNCNSCFLPSINQLNPIERFAMKFVEDTGAADWAAVQLRAVEEEIENHKREWEEKQMAQQQQDELERQRAEREENEILTYSREDALNKVNIRSKQKSHLLGKRKLNIANNSMQGKKTNGREIVQNGTQKYRTVKTESPRRRSFRNLNNHEDVVVSTTTKQIKLEQPKASFRKTNRSTSIISAKSKTRSASESTSRSSGNRHTMTPDDSNSECSLDVMIDSNDVNDSDSNSNHKTKSHFDRTSHEDESLMNEDSTMTDETIIEKDGKQKSFREMHKKNTSSPRTRSRGTVNVNLWTLDESPIEPMKRQKHKSISENHRDEALREKFAIKECAVEMFPVNINDKTKSVQLSTPVKTPKIRKRFLVKNNQTLDGWVKKAESPKHSEDSEDKKELPTRARRSTIIQTVANKTL